VRNEFKTVTVGIGWEGEKEGYGGAKRTKVVYTHNTKIT
jgi:hypothetical protein